jgi:hypothetical protein
MEEGYMQRVTRSILVFALSAGVSAKAQEEPKVIKNVTVYKEAGRFAGWPANNGIWSWGSEIVVGFSLGYHDNDPKQTSHPIKGPNTQRQARSIDGGETWRVEKPSFLDEEEREKEATACPGNIDFTQPNFAFKFRTGSGGFYYSTDRCKTWIGPFSFPTFGRKGLLARTDYIINGKHDMFVFLTSPKDNGKEGWPFCARTQDGGKTWQMQGWIGEQLPLDRREYAIMPATVRLENGALLSIIRRGGYIPGKKASWLEGWLSPDEGKSWYALKEPYVDNSGNPASMFTLQDGRLALSYGVRRAPYGIRARISEDQGQTWGGEIILRNDSDSWDLGYPRTVQRPDGKIVTVYYFKDAGGKERYIAATIWDPGRLTQGPGSTMNSASKRGDKQPIVRWAAPLPDTNRANRGYDLLPNTHTFTLYEAEPVTGTYSHHPHITHFKGAIYAMWSNHAKDEDAPGQRVLMRRSTDQGNTWAELVELFPPLDRVGLASEDGKGRRTQCANGFANVENTLYAFSEVWDDGGDNRQAGQGRLVRSIRQDGLLGDPFWLRNESPVEIPEVPAYPAGDPATVEKINTFLRLPENELTWDFRYLTTDIEAKDGHRLCEPTPAWQLRDGTWVKLYRDLGKPVSHHNYASFSVDGGEEWTAPTRTDFIDGCARTNAGTLPDGQVYIISNIDPDGARDPLAISLSRDGLNFDRVSLIRSGAPAMRYEGRWKCDGFQYPHSLLLGDNLWVVYSVGKEDVQLTRIPINELIGR